MKREQLDGTVQDEVVLTGSKVTGPILLATVTFSNITASSTYLQAVTNVLSKSAKKRCFFVKNSLNQPLTSAKLWLQDSSVYTGTAPAGDAFSDSTTMPLAAQTAVYGSDKNTILAQTSDSLLFGIGMGAVAPTSGDVKIYVTEVQ